MMKKTHFIKNRLSRTSLALLLALMTALQFSPAYADSSTFISPYALEQALATNDHMDLYAPKDTGGFNLSSAYYSGYASGFSNSDHIESLSNDEKLYALLIDGRYDFTSDALSLSSPLHPYLSGGVGMASLGHIGGGAEFDAQSGNAVPLIRFGGGVAYKMNEKWNLSLDYKAGTALSSGDQVFTGRSQQQVDLQQLNLGMSYAF